MQIVMRGDLLSIQMAFYPEGNLLLQGSPARGTGLVLVEAVFLLCSCAGNEKSTVFPLGERAALSTRVQTREDPYKGQGGVGGGRSCNAQILQGPYEVLLIMYLSCPQVSEQIASPISPCNGQAKHTT